jgi:hypothetical protein
MAMAIAELPALVASIARGGRVTAEDIRNLQDHLFGDMLVEEEEAEWLFLIDRACAVKAPEWSGFFFESVVSVVVHQLVPRGQLDEAKASWLLGCVAPGGVICTFNALEALVRIIETASAAPTPLAAFALREVGAAVLEGRGPLAGQHRHRPGAIGEIEAEFVRRILCARGLHQRLSRAEAEILFQLNDRSAEEDNAAIWSDLFVASLVSFLMPAGEDRHDLAAGPADGSLEALWRDLALRAAPAQRPRSYWGEARLPRRPEPASAENAKWLAGRIGRGGALSANERLLLEVLFEENPDLHPSLRTLVDTAA